MKNCTTKITFTVPVQLDLQSPALGKYGLLYRDYLKAHRNGYYTALLVSGKLPDHLREIDEDARRLRDNMLPKYMRMYEITEQLKAEDQTEWIRRMNTVMHQIDEFILSAVVYQ